MRYKSTKHLRRRISAVVVSIALGMAAFAGGMVKEGTVVTQAAGYSLSATALTMECGNETYLTINGYDDWYGWWYGVYPTYKSSKPDVVSVTSDGRLIALKAGKSTITVTYDGVKMTCKVTVKKSSTSISKTDITMYANDTATVKISNKSHKGTSYGYDYIVLDAATWTQIYDGGIYAYSLYSDWSDYYTPGEFEISARQAGEYDLMLRLTDENGVHYGRVCHVTVLPCGLTETQHTAKVGDTWKVKPQNATNVTYSIGDESIASVTSNGTVTMLSYGSTTLYCTFTNPGGNQITQSCSINVSNPVFTKPSGYMFVWDNYYPNFEQSYSSSTWELKSSNEKVAKPAEGLNYFQIVGVGKAKLTIVCDGVKATTQIQVIDPQFASPAAVLLKGKKLNLKMTGTGDCTVKYSSSDKTVAAVSAKGVVTGKKTGSAVITATVANREYQCTVTVGTNAGVKAAAQAYSVLGATYSQDKRMQKGYYDCSSLVWRSYSDIGVKLAGATNYAPTAADLAKQLEKEGKAIYYEYVEADKLQPGDLIFYAGGGNGRYKNIDHAAMYYGAYYDYDWWTGDYMNYGYIVHASGANVHMKPYPNHRTGSIVMICRPMKK